MSIDIFEVSVELPGAPKYYIYKEALAYKLKEKLDKEYGQEFTVSIKKHLNKKDVALDKII